MLRGALTIPLALLPWGWVGLARAESPPEGSAGSVSGLLAGWQKHSARVRVVLPETLGADWLPAGLAADALVRSLSAQPVTAADASAAATLRLSPLPLAAATNLEVAVVEAEAGTLTVSAMSAQDVARTLIRLRQPVLQSTCNTRLCQIPLVAEPQRPPDRARSPNKDPRSDAQSQVFTVGERGYPGGYTARGEGRHVLAFSFHRPVNWQIEEWPTLRLFVDRSLHPALDGAASAVEVRLHGLSLGRFPLTARAGRVLLVSQPIPASFWDLPVWDFEVISTLASTSGLPAATTEVSPLWLSIAPRSSLYVPRREPQFPHSLAAWHRRMAEGPPQLRLSQPLPSALLPALGAALFPWSGPAPWRIAEAGTRCLPPCRELRIVYSNRPAGGLASDGMTIAVESDGSDAPSRAVITLWPAGAVPGPVASPDYGAVVTTALTLRDGRFSPSGDTARQGSEVRIRGPSPPTDDVHSLVSDRATQRVQFDWAWSVVCLLLLALGWRRSGQRSQVWLQREPP